MATNLLDAFEFSISSGDFEGFKLLVESVDYSGMSYNDILDFAKFLTEPLVKYAECKFITYLLEYMESNLNMSDIPILIRIIRTPLFTDKEVEFYVKCSGKGRYEMFADIIETKENEEDNVFAFSRIENIFGNLEYDEYDVLREKSAVLCMTKIHDYITARMEETSDFAPIPEWIIESSPEGEIPGIGKGEDVNLNLAERYMTDEEVFRRFGPANGYLPLSVDDDETICSKYGSCRMLHCNHVDESDDDYWFTGTCDFCARKIRKMEHAVRAPGIYGGWKGCYCSFDCIRNSNKVSDSVWSGFQDETEESAARIFFDGILNAIESKVLEIGIYGGN